MTPPPLRVDAATFDVTTQSVARAFANDPMIRAGLRADVTVDEIAGIVRALFAEYVKVGAAWQLGDGLAAAAWLAPVDAAAFELIDQATRSVVPQLTDDDGASYGAFWEWITEHIPAEPVWLLDLIGVDPAVRGRGYGQRLVRLGLSLAQADGLPAFLETANPRNVAYYEGLGFGVIASEEPPGDGPRVWFMRHDG
jgi:ribosomal protein S18 acetylase RimI-like enzyme